MPRIYASLVGEYQVSDFDLPLSVMVSNVEHNLNFRTEDLNRFFDAKKRPTRYTRLSQEERRQYVQLVAEHIFSGRMFRGMLVSTLTCQECNSTSSRYEEFLDLSLPTYVDKLEELVATKRNAPKSKKRSEAERRSKRNTEQPLATDETDEEVDHNGNDVPTESTSDLLQPLDDSGIICNDKKGIFANDETMLK